MIALTNSSATDAASAPVTTPAAGFEPRITTPPVRPAFPLLVALADDACGDATLAMARALVHDRGASPTVVNVVELGTGTEIGAAALLETLELDPEFQGAHVAALRRRFAAAGVLERWPVVIHAGDSSASILQVAAEIQPELIVMGLGRHSRLARAAGEATAHEVMRAGIAPVLAIPASETPPEPRLPTKVLVAMDFSAASIRAAHVARRVMGDRGTLHLAHVRFPLIEHDGERYEGLQVVQTAGVQAAFEAVSRELSTEGIAVTSTVVDGDAATSLLALAATLQPDLIAIGSQRHHWLERLLLGSVARAVADDGRWPVLVTPPRPRPAPTTSGSSGMIDGVSPPIRQ